MPHADLTAVLSTSGHYRVFVSEYCGVNSTIDSLYHLHVESMLQMEQTSLHSLFDPIPGMEDAASSVVGRALAPQPRRKSRRYARQQFNNVPEPVATAEPDERVKTRYYVDGYRHARRVLHDLRLARLHSALSTLAA